MKAIGVREFRDTASKVLRGGELVLITNREKPEGLYIPLSSINELPAEMKREILRAFSSRIARKLEAAGISEEEVLEEFARLRDHRG